MTLNPHAPAPTFARRLLGRFHVTGVFWYHFPYWGFTHLPLWTERAITVFFVTFFFVTLGRIRRAIASNLEAVLGPAGFLDRRIRAFRTMYAFGSCMVERYRFLVAPDRFRFLLEGEEHWRRVMKPGGGVVLVTAHIGFWEIAPSFGAAEENRRIHIVREKEIDPRAQEFIREILARDQRCVFHFAGEDPALSMTLLEALRNGEIVAFQADRPRAGGRTVPASLFGKPMPLPVGPAALARAADVPILPVFNFREGRYLMRVSVREPVLVARSTDREADIAAAVHTLAGEIEWAVRRHPHQWFCFRALWDRRQPAA